MFELLSMLSRIISQSGRSATEFYCGVGLRLIERILDLLPFFVAYLWFSWIYSMVPTRQGWQQTVADSLWSILPVLAAILFCQLLCSFFGQRLTFLGSYNIIAGYRERIINQVHRIPVGILQRYRVGQLTEIMTEDVTRLEGIFTHITAEILSSILAVTVLAVFLFYMDWTIALSMLIFLPVAVSVLVLTRRYFILKGREKQALFGRTSGLLIEFVMGIRTLRLFNRTGLWLERLNVLFLEIRKRSLGVEALGGGPVQAYRLLLEYGLVAMLVCMALLTSESGTVPLYWLLYLLIAHKLFQPLYETAENITIFRFAAESENRLRQLLETPLLPEPDHPEQPQDYSIRFDNVGFGYTHGEKVLEGISFTVQEGTLTAIVGASGSGKTTLLNLLARFYDPQQGSIRLGGVDIRSLGSQGLYRHLSMVFQQVQLNRGTVLDNIAMGRPEAGREEIEEASRNACCEDFIGRLAKGYDTYVGEDGAGLSGGERQRISIARALLKNAPVLLLDEATASVDPLAQYQIQQALSRLAAGRTVVMIAHRLNTVRFAEQIIVLDKGRIAGCGRHDELLAHNALYRRLWEAQNTTVS